MLFLHINAQPRAPKSHSNKQKHNPGPAPSHRYAAAHKGIPNTRGTLPKAAIRSILIHISRAGVPEAFGRLAAYHARHGQVIQTEGAHTHAAPHTLNRRQPYAQYSPPPPPLDADPSRGDSCSSSQAKNGGMLYTVSDVPPAYLGVILGFQVSRRSEQAACLWYRLTIPRLRRSTTSPCSAPRPSSQS